MHLLEPGIILSTKIFYNLDLKEIKNNFNSNRTPKSPSLIYGCAKDKTVPVSHPKRISETLNKSSKYLEFGNCSNHGDAFIYNKDKYVKEIYKFLKIQFENEHK